MFLGRPYFYIVYFFSKLFVKYIFPEVSSFDEMKLKSCEAPSRNGKHRGGPCEGNGGKRQSTGVLGMDFPTACLGKESGQSSFCPAPLPPLADPIFLFLFPLPVCDEEEFPGPWSPLIFICTPCPIQGPPALPLFKHSALPTCHLSAFLVHIRESPHIPQWWGTS